MIFRYHRRYQKKYKNLPIALKEKVKEREALFIKEPFHPILNNHALSGSYAGFRSINTTGDWRLIYIVVGNEVVLFVDIDTHSNLYGN